MRKRRKGVFFRRPRPSGFTLIESVIVVGIIGVLAVAFYPSVKNAFEIRGFDNAARDVLTTLHQAKWQAVTSKYFHRVRFIQDAAGWTYRIEIEKPFGTWTLKQGQPVKRVPREFNFVPLLPSGNTVVFDGTGFVQNYDGTKNSMTLSSTRIALLGEANVRLIQFYTSGSIKMTIITSS